MIRLFDMVSDYGSKGRGYREEDAIHYVERLSLRAPVCLIPVDASVPALTMVKYAAPDFAGPADARANGSATVI